MGPLRIKKNPRVIQPADLAPAPNQSYALVGSAGLSEAYQGHKGPPSALTGLRMAVLAKKPQRASLSPIMSYKAFKMSLPVFIENQSFFLLKWLF